MVQLGPTRPDPESVRWEHALLRFLATEIEQVVAPLAALDGSTFYVDGGDVVSVFPFLEGDELRSRRGALPTRAAGVARTSAPTRSCVASDRAASRRAFTA